MIQEKAIQAGVARVFDDAASYYRDMRWEKNRVVRFEQLLTRQTIEEELGGDSVAKALELGCGPGTWTGTLSDRAGRVLAVDLSQAMLGQAGKALAERSNIELRHVDIGAFDPGGETFDRILSVRVLEYVPEWRQAVETFGRWLAPGGRAVVGTKTPISVWRGPRRGRWVGPRTLGRRLTGRTLNPEFWQRYIPVRAMVAGFVTAGVLAVKVCPFLFCPPGFIRGAKQDPRVPPLSRQSVLSAPQAS